MKKIVAVELFCGAGGLTRGLSDAGIRVVKGVDTDCTARETYESNNPGSKFVKADVSRISVTDLMDGVGRRGADLLLAGCAPCQPFSKHGVHDPRDKRRSLVRHFARLVGEIKPEYVIMENVPQFGKPDNAYRAGFLRMLQRHGYSHDEGVANAAEYGVPQSRHRYVLLASKNGPIRIPPGDYGKKKRFRTVRDAIGKYPRIGAGESSPHVANHDACGLSDANRRRIRATPRDGGSRTDVRGRGMALRCHRNTSGHTDVYGRMRWDRPAPTLTCRCVSFSNGRFGHPVQNRAISVREAAALQTFPDSYVFRSTKTGNAEHIGNAVPVLLAKTLGRAVVRSSGRATGFRKPGVRTGRGGSWPW